VDARIGAAAVVFGVGLLTAAPLPAQTAACPTTLGHLAARLPSYQDPQLQQLRAQILATNVTEALAQSGQPRGQAAITAVQQAHQLEQSNRQVEECIVRAEGGGQGVVGQLKSGTYQMPPGTATGILDSCVRAWVVNDWGIVASRETAVLIGCSMP
jgi:hypothetical protein